MSLRLDDFNQKENMMRLSLQTVDYKLEEFVLQTMNKLSKIENAMADQRDLMTLLVNYLLI